MKAPIKYTMFVVSVVLLAGGIYGAYHIDQSFDMLALGTDDSSFVQYFRIRNKEFPNSIPVSVILSEQTNYTDISVQKEIMKLSALPEQNPYMLNANVNWMWTLKWWAASKGRGTLTTGKYFYPRLREFLTEYPQFLADLKFDKSGTISASRMLMFTVDNDNSIFRKDGMLTLRKQLEEQSALNVYPVHLMYIYFEQFAVIFGDTLRNLSVCSGAILLITLPYLIHPIVTLMVFFSFVSLIFQLLAVMYLWSVSLNSISMIIIVMSIGFAVDYSAHVAHAFVGSKSNTPEGRVVDSLRTMGSSVLMGGK